MLKRRFSVLLLALAALAACASTPELPGSPVPTPTPEAAATLPPIPTPEPTPTPDPVEERLKALSEEERVGQLLVTALPGTEAGAQAETAIGEYQVGGVILFRSNIESGAQLTGLLNSLQSLNGDHVPLFLCVDQEGGRVDRMPSEVLRTPSAQRVGGSQSPETAQEYGAVLALACGAFGFNMDFAPCLDIWSNPENTVIGDRALGRDGERVAQLGLAALEGMARTGGVIPVVKHFPGHGDTSLDSHAVLPVVDKSLEELRQNELIPFRRAVQAGAPAVMTAHLLLTQLDPERPASLSPAVVTGLLREELGFNGVVCTDDLTMGAIANTYGIGEAAVLAVEAGCDLLLVCGRIDDLEQARGALLDAVREGRISQERLDESVRRILTLKQAYGLSGGCQEAGDLEALNGRIAGLWEQ